jgi:cytochrome c oxidase assembly protein subunit 15
MTTTPDKEQRDNRQIAVWLLVCCGLVYCMIILGGVTRLTHSGLSMVEWEPIVGTIPPLSQNEWEETFQKYQQFPEYQKLNRGMSLDEFKSIFWFEYAHRLLGRSIGIVFLLPFLYFLFARKVSRSLVPKLVVMFVLGGLQGLLGWYMVKSGLVDKPHVSQYRLTAHLMVAVAIYSYMLWVALSLLSPTAGNANSPGIATLRRYAVGVTALVILMILSGGFVAGTRAGFAFNTFPLMQGYFFPPGMFAMDPAYINLFENIATVQFNHRIFAYVLCIAIPLFWFASRRFTLNVRTQAGFHVLLIALVLQVILGISTLLLVVPVPLAAAHQGGALIVLTAALFINHELRRHSADSR